MSKTRIAFVGMLTLCLAFAGCPAQNTVPGVVGLTHQAANLAISAAHLTLGSVTNQASASVPAGSVISQVPPAGASVAGGTAVSLVISTGPAPSTAWVFSPMNNAIEGLTVDSTQDGGFIVGGGNTWYNMYALKLSATGLFEWHNTYSNLGPAPNLTELWRCMASGLRQTADGGYIMVGSGHNLTDTLPDKSYLLVKLNSTGAVTWSQAHAPQNPYSIGHTTINNFAGDLCVTAEGGYAVFGSSYCGGYSLASMLKTNAAGTMEFAKVINDNARDYEQQIQAGQQTSDNGYILAGYSGNPSSYGYMALLIKVSSNGTLEWSQTYQYPPQDHGATAYAVTQTADNGYLVGGRLINDIPKVSNYGCWLAKVNSAGLVVWSRDYADTPTINCPNAIKETPQGDFLAVGDIGGDVTLSKFNAAGTLLWNYTRSDLDSCTGKDLVLTPDGGCVIVASGNTGGPTLVLKVNNAFTPVD